MCPTLVSHTLSLPHRPFPPGQPAAELFVQRSLSTHAYHTSPCSIFLRPAHARSWQLRRPRREEGRPRPLDVLRVGEHPHLRPPRLRVRNLAAARCAFSEA
eukprot:6214616-Pleurochrysis_carterae.AAC.2